MTSSLALLLKPKVPVLDEERALLVSERLHKGHEKKKRKEKTANDPLLTTLPHETIRFLRKHRTVNSKERVPMPHFLERQLREMFVGLDYTNSGAIDLKDLKEALKYVETELAEKAKNKTSLGKLKRKTYNYSKVYTIRTPFH